MSTNTNPLIDAMFSVGAHFGLGRSRRNPTVAKYIFATKNNTDIFDLEKTEPLLVKAKQFVADLAKEGKIILFVGGKKEAAIATKNTAKKLGMPYVDGRWIGGTLTNLGQMRKRIERYEKLVSDKEKGELSKYTKRERMLLDKEIAKLEKMFIGTISLKKLPDAVFVVDPRYEKTAVAEARQLNVLIIALGTSDCNFTDIKYPIVGNDATKLSISFFLDQIAEAYESNRKTSVQ